MDRVFRILIHFLSVLSVIFLCSSCGNRGAVTVPFATAGDTAGVSDVFTLSDITDNGEMIMLTLYGPETYYDYRGRGMGTQFLLCERFAHSIGVSLRVVVCRDTTDIIDRMTRGEGDVVAMMLPRQVARDGGLLPCGVGVDSLDVQWAVREGNTDLAKAIDGWYRPSMIDDVRAEARRPQVKRRVYAPYLNRSAGVISRYDALFKKYAPVARWDWRLLAAQCYQESCFDSNAKSWAGACGLMQIMPETADVIGLERSKIFVPEDNIAAAARYIKKLNATFSDITNASERQCFVLAAYNCGAHHVRDAMALTAKRGGNKYRWADVSRNMMLLKDPKYYNDPVVKYGYMRSDETVNYVSLIRRRYAQYRGAPASASGSSKGIIGEPQKATKNHKYKPQ